MAFSAGVDLGTTFTAAAITRDGQTEMFRLGSSGFTIPSVLYFAEGGAMTTGETARRRLTTEPDRVAAEFKRRLGDPAPLMIGGAPYAAHLLTGRLLDWVVDRIEEQEGERPQLVTVTHPANWGPFRLELMDQAIKSADVEQTTTITEPEAAAIAYATTRQVPPGAVVAVYDLGGGTFDAAILRRTDDGFELIGTPDGVEQLGGLDFDAALFGLVTDNLGSRIDDLDPQDPNVRAAMHRLREECIAAKIALSSDTDATVPVILPGHESQIRITRQEFEDRITPLLQETIGALARTLRSASVEPDEIDRVLLVGGSSRIPLVGRLVTQELGRPVAIDADPKNAIARGAAIHAHDQLTKASGGFAPPSAPPVGAAPAARPASPPPANTPPAAATPPPAATPPAAAPPPATTPAPAAAPATPAPTVQQPATPVPTPTIQPPAPATPTGPPAGGGAGGSGGGRTKLWLLGGGVAALVALVVGFVAFGGGDDEPPEPTTQSTDIPSDNILSFDVGDCLDISARGEIEVSSCRDFTIGEVFLINESQLGDGSNPPFPGFEALDAEFRSLCEAEIETFEPQRLTPPFVAEVVTSDEEEWEDFDSRRVLCLATPATLIQAFQVDRCYSRDLLDPSVTNEVLLTVVPCDPPFFGSIFAVDTPEAVNGAFPGAQALLVDAIPRCEAAFEPSTGVVLADSGLLVEAIIPNEQEWDAGLRNFACGSYATTGIVSFAPTLCTTTELADDGSGLSFVSVTACTEVVDGELLSIPHDGEVISQVTLAGGPDSPFPGNQAIFDEAQPLCDEAFEPYIGVPPEQSSLQVFVVAPGEFEWNEQGVRQAACVVERIDQNPLDGPVQQSFL